MDPEQLGIVLGIVLCGVLIVHVLNNISNIMKEMEIKEATKINCPPHKWVYVYPIQGQDTVYMVCNKCNFRAGSNKDDN